MSRPWRRLAFTGSTKWPTGPGWELVVTGKAEDYLLRMPENSTLYVRHGHADDGVDAIVHRWVQRYLECVEAFATGRPGLPVPIRPDVEIVEEALPADWASCGPRCKPTKSDGSAHRRPNPGWPHAPKRGHLADYCPAAGHRRNPHVVGFDYEGAVGTFERRFYRPLPDARTSLLMAFVFNNSPGAMATLRHAQTMGVPWDAKGAYE